MFQKFKIATLAVSLTLASVGCKQNATQQEKTSEQSATGFNGDIKLDVRDSKPDWGPFIRKKAPEGSPNILFILYDDTGLAAWSPYGGRISMPTLDKLAADGLTYTQWLFVLLPVPASIQAVTII